MQKLQCELCGSVDIVRTDDGFFQCQHCGCKYTLAQAKALLGTVETTIGTAELERLLNNAKTQLEIGQFNEAQKTYREITKQFPGDYRAWLELLRIGYNNSHMPSLDGIKVCLKLAPNEKVAKEITDEWTAAWEKTAANLREGKFWYSGESDPELYKDTCPAMYEYAKIGLENARILNALEVCYSEDEKQWVPIKPNQNFYKFWLGQSCEDKRHESRYYNYEKILPPIDDAYIAQIKKEVEEYSFKWRYRYSKCPCCHAQLKSRHPQTICPKCGKNFC